LLRISNLAPPDDGEMGSLVRLGQMLVDDSPRTWFHLYSLGIAHYRAGQYQPAIGRLRESLDLAPSELLSPLSYPVLAMAHYASGDAALARQALSEAEQVLERWTQARFQPHDAYWVWHRGAEVQWPIVWWDWLEFEHYYREARQLVDG